MSVIHANLEGGTTIFSLDPEGENADEGIVPYGITVLALVDLAKSGFFLRAQVQQMYASASIIQDSFLTDDGPVATDTRVARVRTQLAQVDCGGVQLWPNRIFYAHRNSFRHSK